MSHEVDTRVEFRAEVKGSSRQFLEVMKQINEVVPTDAGLAIQGESDIGKHLLAKSIHETSGRRDAPLVTLNCTVIPYDLRTTVAPPIKVRLATQTDADGLIQGCTNIVPAVSTNPPAPLFRSILAHLLVITKPEIILLIVVTVITGFCLARRESHAGFPIVLLMNTLIGTMLAAGGSGALNQYMERGFDVQMRRTARRPLALGAIAPRHALWFGLLLSFCGLVYLALAVNALCSLLALITLVLYLGAYTPLRRKTAFCTVVGAFPGAVPPLIGCAAASGGLLPVAWILYALLFFWQFPHFMSIAWMYREGYKRAGYIVLPNGGARDAFFGWTCLLPGCAFALVAVLPTLVGIDGQLYLYGAGTLSAGFLSGLPWLVLNRSNAAARKMLFASLVILPSIFLLMLADAK
jgi:protoheme IX farnesyltransferase